MISGFLDFGQSVANLGLSSCVWMGFPVKHRRWVDILADVLSAAGNGTRKTRIMQKANLSYQLLKKYLEEAVSNELLQPNSFGFELTEKGQKFLERYRLLHEEYSKVRRSLQSLMSKWETLEHTCRHCSSNTSKTDTRGGEKNLEKTISRSEANNP